MKFYRQCEFRKGVTRQTAWVEDKPGLREGSKVELKSEVPGDRLNWEVLSIGGRASQEFLDTHRAHM